MPRPRRQPDAEITIDGEDVRVFEGETILSAARRAGVPIPTLCYVEGLSVWGGCRLCVVQVAGEQPLRLACATPVVDEMEVTTNAASLVEHRREIVELLFAEGNHICSVCVSNGACELQDLAVDLDVDHIRFDYQFPDRGVDLTHPRYGLDHNRCILCSRCVRVCDEIEGAHVWEIASRGSGSYLVAELGEPWGDAASCTSCGKCVAVCPTGALFYKGRAVGEMRHDASMIDFLETARETGEWMQRDGHGPPPFGDPTGEPQRARASGSEPAGGDQRVRASGSEPAGGDQRVRASGSEPAGGDLKEAGR